MDGKLYPDFAFKGSKSSNQVRLGKIHSSAITKTRKEINSNLVTNKKEEKYNPHVFLGILSSPFLFFQAYIAYKNVCSTTEYIIKISETYLILDH